MADNLAVSGDDDPSLDSILSRLNSLGESAAGIKESAPTLRGVPDLEDELDDDSSDSSEDIPGPASLTVVGEVVDEAVVDSPAMDSAAVEAESTESPFRSKGLFDSTAQTEVSEATPPTEAVAAPVVNADALAAFLGTGDQQDKSTDSDESIDSEQNAGSVAEDSSSEDAESDESEAPEQEAPKEDVSETTDVEVQTPEKIDYFADLHSGDAPQIAGVAADKRADFVPEPELDEGVTAVQAFSHHPEQREVILTDTKGLLADPLDIKPATPKKLDAAAYDDLFSHGVQFPEVGTEQTFGAGLDPSDPLYVENPFDDAQAKEKSISIQSVVFVVLLVIAVIVLFMILGDSARVDELREGVTSISE